MFLTKVCGLKIDYVDPNVAPYYHFSSFSASYIALFEFVKLLGFSMKKDLQIFLRMGFLGAACVSTMIIFVIIYGFISISNTQFEFRMDPTESDSKGRLWGDPNN